MSKKQISSFVDLTLFKQDIAELVQIFQNYLQDVEFVIDERRIVESTQLEQYEAAYQAQSLLARGYWSGTTGKDADGQSERLLIELRMNKVMAVLTGWDSVGKSEFLERIRKVLLRRNTSMQQTLQVVTVGLFLGPLLSVILLLERHSISSILQLLSEIGAIILAIPVFVLLFAFIVKRLKLEKRIFLFPGKTTTTQVYHRSGMVARLVVALVLLIVFDGFLVILFRLL
ncbi:hypothetical protein ccbrp13_30620 [Ktedonobacteria bacterium brp13]|nr:hypothetical protein ccbrp13_30620 [Ktedonobacteria bacterium brp13]